MYSLVVITNQIQWIEILALKKTNSKNTIQPPTYHQVTDHPIRNLRPFLGCRRARQRRSPPTTVLSPKALTRVTSSCCWGRLGLGTWTLPRGNLALAQPAFVFRFRFRFWFVWFRIFFVPAGILEMQECELNGECPWPCKYNSHAKRLTSDDYARIGSQSTSTSIVWPFLPWHFRKSACSVSRVLLLTLRVYIYSCRLGDMAFGSGEHKRVHFQFVGPRYLARKITCCLSWNLFRSLLKHQLTI